VFDPSGGFEEGMDTCSLTTKLVSDAQVTAVHRADGEGSCAFNRQLRTKTGFYRTGRNTTT
jgi:hypothetical protein